MSLLKQFQPNLQVMSPQALAFQKAIGTLPDPNEDPKAYRTAMSALNDKFADFLRLQTQVQLVELSQQDPDEFMRVMPKILDNFIPKMKSVESKVEAIIDNRVYVETAYREPIPFETLKRAGVVIDSEAEPGVRETPADEPQSPVRAGDSHPAPSVPTARAVILNSAQLNRPLSAAVLAHKMVVGITDDEVLS